MSRKHNCKKTGSTSNYRKRLEARGLGRTPAMRDYLGVNKRPGREDQTQNQGRRP